MGRTKYDHNNPRLPIFYARFHEMVEAKGGVTKVSELTGISRPTINYWYNGERTPDAESLITISNKLGVSIDWLLGRVNEDNPTSDETLSLVSEYTSLGNDSVYMLKNISSIAYGRKTVNTLISNPLFYQFISYLSTYLFSTWVEEFTEQTEGHVSTLKPINDNELFEKYIQPAMLSRITETLIRIKDQVEERSEDNG